MRRFTENLVLIVAILAAVGLAAGCGGTAKNAIASFAPTRSASAAPTRSASAAPTRSADVSPSASAGSSASPSASVSPSPSASVAPSPSATAATTTVEPATSAAAAPAQPTGSAAPGSGSPSGLVWLWALLGAVVLIGAILLIARARRRHAAAAAGWQSRVIDAYAKGAALHDAMSVAETPGALAAADAPARWSDIQRRADDLAQTLYALREAAPDDESRARVTDALASLQAVRSAMDAERAPGGAGPQQAGVARSRLFTFEASLRALRDPYRRAP